MLNALDDVDMSITITKERHFNKTKAKIPEFCSGLGSLLNGHYVTYYMHDCLYTLFCLHLKNFLTNTYSKDSTKKLIKKFCTHQHEFLPRIHN